MSRWKETAGHGCGEDSDASIVVLGLGNVLLGDDGLGVHVVDRLTPRFDASSDVRLVDGGTLGFSLLEIVEAARVLIVVDAMALDLPPGSVRLFVDGELDRFLAAPAQRSVHDVNLGDLLRMSALRGMLPEHRVLVGVQPRSIDWRETPGESVSAGIDVACEKIRELITGWTS